MHKLITTKASIAIAEYDDVFALPEKLYEHKLFFIKKDNEYFHYVLGQFKKTTSGMPDRYVYNDLITAKRDNDYLKKELHYLIGLKMLYKIIPANENDEIVKAVLITATADDFFYCSKRSIVKQNTQYYRKNENKIIGPFYLKTYPDCKKLLEAIENGNVFIPFKTQKFELIQELKKAV